MCRGSCGGNAGAEGGSTLPDLGWRGRPRLGGPASQLAGLVASPAVDEPVLGNAARVRAARANVPEPQPARDRKRGQAATSRVAHIGRCRAELSQRIDPPTVGRAVDGPAAGEPATRGKTGE